VRSDHDAPSASVTWSAPSSVTIAGRLANTLPPSAPTSRPPRCQLVAVLHTHGQQQANGRVFLMAQFDLALFPLAGIGLVDVIMSVTGTAW
jgi:hypothetical protein